MLVVILHRSLLGLLGFIGCKLIYIFLEKLLIVNHEKLLQTVEEYPRFTEQVKKTNPHVIGCWPVERR